MSFAGTNATICTADIDARSQAATVSKPLPEVP